MSINDLLQSEQGIRLAIWLGRLMPRRAGLALACLIADRISKNPESPEVQAVHANQQILEGGTLTPEALEQRTRAIFRNAGQGQFEVFHYLSDMSRMVDRIVLDERIQEGIRATQEGKQGIVFACPHTGNFDLAGRALGLMGLRALILAEPAQRGDYMAQNALRRRAGLEIAPISIEALRLAHQRLLSGGSLLTGLDWPVSEARFRPRFCGRPSLLPTGHIRLAINANVPVVVVACLRRPDGKYQLLASPNIPMQPYGDPAETILRNTETVLEVAEGFIRRDPEQWMMFHRVWEEKK